MGQIKQKLVIEGNKGKKEMYVLFDSGASRSVIVESKAKKICKISKLVQPLPLKLPNGQTMPVTGSCMFEMTLEGSNKEHCRVYGTAYTSPNIKPAGNVDLVLGVPEMQQHKIKLIFDQKGDKLDLSSCATHTETL